MVSWCSEQILMWGKCHHISWCQGQVLFIQASKCGPLEGKQKNHTRPQVPAVFFYQPIFLCNEHQPALDQLWERSIEDWQDPVISCHVIDCIYLWQSRATDQLFKMWNRVCLFPQSFQESCKCCSKSWPLSKISVMREKALIANFKREKVN